MPVLSITLKPENYSSLLETLLDPTPYIFCHPTIPPINPNLLRDCTAAYRGFPLQGLPHPFGPNELLPNYRTPQIAHEGRCEAAVALKTTLGTGISSWTDIQYAFRMLKLDCLVKKMQAGYALVGEGYNIELALRIHETPRLD